MPRRACGAAVCGNTSEEESAPGRACGAIHEWGLPEFDECGKHFRGGGVPGRASGGIHEDGFASLWYLWEGLQSGGYLKRHMRAVHEGMVPQCTICTIIYLYIILVGLYWWG